MCQASREQTYKTKHDEPPEEKKKNFMRAEEKELDREIYGDEEGRVI